MDPNKYEQRHDLVKGISILFVLLWHFQPVAGQAHPGGWLIEWFYCQISLIAVPSFVIVSLVVYGEKRRNNPGYFLRRTKVLGRRFFVWGLVQCGIFSSIAMSGLFPHYPRSLFTFPVFDLMLFGGPPLPGVGDSVFYFFLLLMVLTVLFEIFCRLRKVLRCIAVVAIGLYTIVGFYSSSLERYQDIGNFLIYIPAAFLLVNVRHDNRWVIVFALLFAAFSIGAAYNPGFDGYGVYSRFSIVFGSLFLFTAAHAWTIRTLHPVTAWLGQHSLWIFALHKYFQLAAIILISFAYRYRECFSFKISPLIVSNAKPLAIFFLAVPMTIGVAAWGQRSPLLRKILG